MSLPTYFDSPVKLTMLRTAAARVIGTPFFANSEAPGRDGGLDCVHTLNWVYRFCGAISHIAIPRQHMDAGAHADRSILIDAFETWPVLHSRFALVWKKSSEFQVPGSEIPSALQPFSPSVLRPGDALCFLAGKVPHHGGILLEHGEFLHCLRGDGVHTMHLDAVLRGWKPLGLVTAVYRPLPLPVGAAVPGSEFGVSSSPAADAAWVGTVNSKP